MSKYGPNRGISSKSVRDTTGHIWQNRFYSCPMDWPLVDLWLGGNNLVCSDLGGYSSVYYDPRRGPSIGSLAAMEIL